jgi:hypothetical protein
MDRWEHVAAMGTRKVDSRDLGAQTAAEALYRNAAVVHLRS